MTVRQTKQLPLRELFERIRHISYAVISPWERLPMDNPSDLIILTDQFRSLETLWNLSRHTQNAQYLTEFSNGDKLVVTVLEKGKHVFPEQFESQILKQRVLHNGCVMVPDNVAWPLTRLYWKLFYENWMASEPDDRKWLVQFVKQRVGGEPLRPKYRWLELTKH